MSSKKIFEIFLVDYDRTRRDENIYLGHSSGRANILELVIFEFREFWPESVIFSAILSIFSPVGADRPTFRDLDERSNLRLLYFENSEEFWDMLYPLPNDS